MSTLKNFRILILAAIFLAIVFGLCFWQQHKVQAYTNPFDEGLFVIEKSDGIAIWNINTRTFNEISIDGMSDTISHPIYDPDGNVYILNMNDFLVHCYTKKSNFTEACLQPTLSLGQTMLDGYGIGIANTMDNQRNIWSPLYFSTSPPATGPTQIVKFNYNNTTKTYTASDYHIYEATGKICSIPEYNNDYTACQANAGTMSGPGGVPSMSAMDYRGNVWVADFTPGKVVCLDGSNDYTYCQGPAFENSRGIVSTYGYPVGIAVDKNNNIYIAANFTDQVKVVRSGSSLSDYYIDYIDLGDLGFTANNNALGLEIDAELNRLYVVDGGHDFDCINLDNNTSCGEVLDYDGTYDTRSFSVDKNHDVWAVDNSAGTSKLLWFDMSNGYAVTDYAPASGDFYASAIDTTGMRMNNLCKYLGGCTLTDYTDINITGTVDPVLKFDIVEDANSGIDTSTCALGALTINTLTSCAYRIGIGTNGLNGFTIYTQDVSSPVGLRSASGSTITNVSDGAVSSGEEYGFNISSLSSGLTAASTYASQDNAVPITATLFFSASAPKDYNKDSNNADTTQVTHKVIITSTTPAGYYTQTIRYTVTGNF